MPSDRRLRFEALEGRQVLATLGLPWPAPERLTLSFAPDGTRIGLFQSDLYSLLGAHRAAEQWQTQILKAFQTWAAQANIDIGLVPDGGQAFGAAGMAQDDPRFGAIRLAAFPQQRALANAVPYLPIAGAWSGDVFLNSALETGLRDPRVDLFTVMLNEAGNVLGIADNFDPDSAMHTDYIAPRTGLASSDVAAIRELYGSRNADSWEGQADNDSIEAAAALDSASSLTDTASWIANAELSTIGDVDHYRFDAPDVPVTVRIRAAGRSLLVPRVSIIDASGNVLASAAAESPLDNDVEVLVRPRRGNASYTVRVEGATNDVFAVGRYQFEIVSRPSGNVPVPGGASSSPSQSPPAFSYLDNEVGENDVPPTATVLTTPWGYAPATRYEAAGSVRTTADVDMYRVDSPAGAASGLLVNVETLGVHPISVQVEVRTAAGEIVHSEAILDADGAQPIEIGSLPPGATYFVSVASDGRGRDVGNYVLILDFVASDLAVEPIASGTLSAAEPYQSPFFLIPRTQLFRFDLSAESEVEAGDARVELAILDDQERPVALTTAANGQTQRLYVWLTTGAYRFRFTRLETGGDSPISYALRGAALSDDTGPGWIDPTEAPLPGDADRNGTVDRGDVRVVASRFTEFADTLIDAADFDADGDVDLADLAVVMLNLGRSLLPTSTTSQPLPSWASAAVGTTSDAIRIDSAPLLDSNVQSARPILYSSAASSRRLQTGQQLPVLEARSTARLTIGSRRLPVADRPLLAATDFALTALFHSPAVWSGPSS